ncbi:MAG: hypothetical protein QOC83_1009 [Pseudonocardiales bacterium]|nr:hypothetical protein [Pseudonocardiales bacterium]
MEIIDPRPLHRRALELATGMVDRVGPADATRPTPCPPWDLSALLGHMIGQNHGFAAALEISTEISTGISTEISTEADVSVSAFAPRPPGPDLVSEWKASTDRLTAAFDGADLARPVLLPEISEQFRFPAAMVIGFHLLDTVVHGWDVATALGLDYRPDDELVASTLRIAEQVPDGPVREQPGASFAPALPVPDGTDPWHRALALLGRPPH